MRADVDQNWKKDNKSPRREETIAAVKLMETKAHSPQISSEKDDSSSDESNPFSSKFEAKSLENTPKVKKQGEAFSTPNMQYSDRYDSKLGALSGTNTGDYDNVMYAVNPHHVSFSSSRYNQQGPQRETTVGRIGGNSHTDSYGPSGPQSSTIMPPSRPSRLTKKQSYFTPSRMETHLPFSDAKSMEHSYHSPNASQTLDRTSTGSTPNISCSLNRSTSDAHLYPDPPAHGPYWNRPNQKSNFSSLKRGSDPCLSMPSSNSNSLSNQRPLRLSRSQLGAPPTHVESTRSLSLMPEDVSLLGISPAQDNKFSTSFPGNSIGETPRGAIFLQAEDSPTYSPSSIKAGSHPKDYSTQVRAMWDHQPSALKQPPALGSESVTLRDLAMSGNMSTPGGKKIHKSSTGAEGHQSFVQNPGFVAVSPDQKSCRPIGSRGQGEMPQKYQMAQLLFFQILDANACLDYSPFGMLASTAQLPISITIYMQ